MKNQFNKFSSLWTNLSFNQRVVLGTLTIGAALTLLFFYRFSQQDYDVMLSNLQESDAAAVVHSLKQQGIPYRLAEGGTTILVPASRKEELRLGIFQEDLIKSDKTVGFGALKSLPFGLTAWQEQKYDQKIISDEVVNTLEKIQGIKKARVILAQGEDSLFSSEKLEPTASVMLIVEPGFRLKTEQVKTIKNLVAHSVPGLKPQNVALSDSMGNSLSDDITSAQGSTGSSESDSLRVTFEKQKSKDILEMLTAVVGHNNAVVKVSALMNFDQSESRIKRLIPSGGSAENPTGIPISVQNNSEAYYGKEKGQKATQGEPGVASNIPTYSTEEVAEETEAKPGSDYRNENVVTNYEISSEERTVIHAPGTVERMSIAVVVNKVLTESQVKEITQLVASASGADYARGDIITVSGLQFSPELKEQQAQSMDILKESNQQELILALVQLAGIFILAIASLFIFYKLIRRPAMGELMEEESAYSHFNQPTEPLIGTTKIPVLEAKLDPELEHIRESINSVVKRDPTEVARVLVTFMKDV